MADLPQRPRPHVLEDESRAAFKQLINGAGWVTRGVTPDYGIDEQVEIFEDSRATGLFFHVQMRATDEVNLRKALRLRLRGSQQAYFAAVDDPVLLARYHAPTQQMFFQWFHRIDHHIGGSPSAVVFDDSAQLTCATVPPLADEVRLFRAMRNVRVHWPIQIVVATALPETTATEFAVTFSAVAGMDQSYVKYVADEVPRVATGSVSVTPGQVVVHLGVTSTTLHTNSTMITPGTLAHDVVFVTGLSLGMAGHVGAGSALMRRAVSAANVVDDFSLLLRAAGVLARARRFRDSIEIGRSLGIRGMHTAGILLVRTTTSLAATDLGPEDIHEVGEYLHHEARNAPADDAGAAASIHYTAGNWFFGRARDYAAAVVAFQRAAELDPAYLARGYYLSELAGALFETGRFDESVELYSRALARSREANTQARLADALMHAGRYTEAALAFEQYEANPIAWEPVWHLKAAALRYVRHKLKVSQERRSPDEAKKCGIAAQLAPNKEEAERLAFQALALDALSPDGWFAIGKILVNSRNDYASARYPLLVGALGNRAPDVWAETYIVSLFSKDVPLATRICEAAVVEHPAAFAEAVRLKVEAFPVTVRDNILRMVADIAAKVPTRPPGITLRMSAGEEEMWEHFVGTPAGF